MLSSPSSIAHSGLFLIYSSVEFRFHIDHSLVLCTAHDVVVGCLLLLLQKEEDEEERVDGHHHNNHSSLTCGNVQLVGVLCNTFDDYLDEDDC